MGVMEFRKNSAVTMALKVSKNSQHSVLLLCLDNAGFLKIATLSSAELV